MEDVLAAAKISRRTFYKHFASKEDVLAEVYELATNVLLQIVDAPAAGAGDRPLGAVLAALDAYLDFHVEDPTLLRVLVEQAIRAESPLAARRAKFRTALVERLDAAVHAATGVHHDPWVFVALISALEGLSLEMLSAGARREDVARAKQVMHGLLERAVLPPSDRRRINPT